MDLKGAEIRNIFDMCMSIGTKNSVPLNVNVPYYQRPYRWDQTRIENLIKDYDKNQKENNNAEYFVGSVVLVENSGGSNSFDIIDGQQRVTTVFLLNYLRFLIQRSYIEELITTRSLNIDGPLENLEKIYTDLLGKSHGEKIKKLHNTIIERMDSFANEEGPARERGYEEIVRLYQKELFLPERDFSDIDKYYNDLEQLQRSFLNGELCLKYSRNAFNEHLVTALSKVCVIVSKDDNPKFHINGVTDSTSPVVKQFTNSIKYEYDQIMKTVSLNDKPLKNTKAILDYITNMLQNIKFCVIITGNERDAYTLFEVLNDRAMEIDDLELIKNMFLKAYCCTSGDSDGLIDNNVGILDNMWGEEIFTGDLRVTKAKLISFLATVYFTADETIFMNTNERFREKIDNDYLSKFDGVGERYTFDKAKRDMQVYLMVRTLIDEYQLIQKSGNAALNCLKAEDNPQVSITYKTIHLINALKYEGVLAAVVNMIIRQFINKNVGKEINIDEFKDYLRSIKEDYNHHCNENEFYEIHRVSFDLWKAIILAKDYEIPREIAKRVIKNASMKNWSPQNIMVDIDLHSKMITQFRKWLSSWSYGKSDLKVRILFIILFKSKYNAEDNVLYFDKAVYSFATDKLQLDHMEAQNPNESAKEKYFNPVDPHEFRENYVHSIGNMMILDSENNNNKNNKPLSEALGYYDNMCSDHWLSNQIKELLNENHTDVTVGTEVCMVPNEKFFKTRAERLSTYFEKIASRNDLYSNKIVL